MFTDDHLRREIADILNRKPSATRKDIVEALYWRATLKWGRVPETVKVWYRHYNSPDEILAKYSPDQPRVPAGNSDGGQWTRDPNASEGGREAREDRGKHAFLTDKTGNVIRNNLGEPIKYPKDTPPSEFIQSGRVVGEAMNSNDPIEKTAGIIKFVADSAAFKHGWGWDIQRETDSLGKVEIRQDLRDYSTVAIGLYYASAGIGIQDCLKIQNVFARLFSEFKEPMSSEWSSLPVRNVENTRIGYALAKSLRRK